VSTREYKGVITSNGRRYYYTADYRIEFPREWEAFVIRDSDHQRDPREHYRIKVLRGQTVVVEKTTPEDVGQQIGMQLQDLLQVLRRERMPVAAGIRYTMRSPVHLSEQLEGIGEAHDAS
jgi:hypothetical protein